MRRKIFYIFLFFLTVLKVDAQMLSVKTNLLSWGLCAPNMAMELVTGERHSLAVSASYMPKLYNKGLHGWMLMPEYRFWLSGRPMVRSYIGVGVLGGNYSDVQGLILKNMKQSGSYAGVATTAGYSFYLGKRWNLEITAGVALAVVHRKCYEMNASVPDAFQPLAMRVFPANLGVTFGYIIK